MIAYLILSSTFILVFSLCVSVILISLFLHFLLHFNFWHLDKLSTTIWFQDLDFSIIKWRFFSSRFYLFTLFLIYMSFPLTCCSAFWFQPHILVRYDSTLFWFFQYHFYFWFVFHLMFVQSYFSIFLYSNVNFLFILIFFKLVFWIRLIKSRFIYHRLFEVEYFHLKVDWFSFLNLDFIYIFYSTIFDFVSLIESKCSHMIIFSWFYLP